MSKKIIAGALSVATAASAFAVLAVPTFAATETWHQVSVTPAQEFVLGGPVDGTFTLTPNISAVDSDTAELTVKATAAWELSWLAVTGNIGNEAKAAAPGTNLGLLGFTDTGGFAYSGTNTAAATGSNNWSAQVAVTGTGALLDFNALNTTTGAIANGSQTADTEIDITYSAGTDGSIPNTATYYGTIYYTLGAQ